MKNLHRTKQLNLHGSESIKKQGNHGNQILIISLRLWTSRPKFHTKKNTNVRNISVYCSVGVIETFFEIQFWITYFYLFYCGETVVISEISLKSTIMAFYQLLASSSWLLTLWFPWNSSFQKLFLIIRNSGFTLKRVRDMTRTIQSLETLINLCSNSYLLKVSNRNTKTKCKICSKLTLKIPERRQWRRSGDFIVNCEHILHLVLLFLLLTLKM